MTPEELALLTDEEREGLELDEEDDGDDAGGDDDQAADDAAAASAATVAGADADASAAADQAADQPGRDDGAAADAPAPVAQNIPLISSNVPEDVQAQLDKINTDRDALSDKFEDGDLTSKEYSAELRKLNKQESDLEWQVRKAELSNETQHNQALQRWYGSVNEFMADHPNIQKSEVLWQAFDGVVKKVTADTANQGLTDRQQLDKAYGILAKELGLKVDPAPATDPKAATQGKAPAKPAKEGKREIPPTLGTVPAADTSTTDDGKYAHLDRLMESDPLAFEAALAKMSPAESEAYLASQ
ncbi:hypothetical protein [Agrobacterium tumefaciens]|uniref:hypothetical protein n=1 Tax=Agrobacterium tumefaciens TaxID=358 RepID=UPI001573161A|nr:hypothetical protein [Agrobacterium tumefaciens]